MGAFLYRKPNLSFRTKTKGGPYDRAQRARELPNAVHVKTVESNHLRLDSTVFTWTAFGNSRALCARSYGPPFVFVRNDKFGFLYRNAPILPDWRDVNAPRSLYGQPRT